MRFFGLSLLALVALVVAEAAVVDDNSPVAPVEAVATTAAPDGIIATPSENSFAQPTASATGLPSEYERLPDRLKQFIADMSRRHELEKRQNAAPGGGAAPATPLPLQLSPVTTVTFNGVATPYTQLFPSVPSQLPSPASGTIGVGSINGTVGVVRTYSSNPAPSRAPDARLMLAVAGGIGAGMML